MIALLAGLSRGKGTTGPAPYALAPPGLSMVVPFPIDRGDDGADTPGTYKGLWLRLVERDAPTVTPRMASSA